MINAAGKQDTHLGKIAAQEASISAFLPYSHMVNDTTVKTKDGYLMQVIKIEGLSFETESDETLSVRKNIRAILLRGMADARLAIYHHIIRRRVVGRHDGHFENSWCQSLDDAYQESLEKSHLFVNEQYITIIRRPARHKVGMIAALANVCHSKLDDKAAAFQETENLRALHDASRHLIRALADYQPRLLGLSKKDGITVSEPLAFFSHLTNFEDSPVRLPEMSLAAYLPRKRISFGHESFELRGAQSDDLKFGAVLSIKEYADHTAPGMMDALLRLPHEFVISQSFAFTDRQSAMGALNETQRKITASEQGAVSLIEELDIARDDLASGRSNFGEHHITITPIASDIHSLNHAVGACTGALINLGIISVREDMNMEAAYWASHPGNLHFIARRALISNQNFAGFASLHTFPCGKAKDNHWGPAITRLETTSGTPYWFNFHERDVGNFTVIGPTGTGKTVLLTFLLAQAQRLSPRAIYFDKDRGAEIFIRAIGGKYTILKSGTPTNLNPLAIADTPANRSFLKHWVKVLLTSDAAFPLSPQEEEIINDAINANFETPLSNRKLSHLATLLAGYSTGSSIKLEDRIAKWHGNGAKAWLFDNAHDTLNLDNTTIGFDLTSVLDDPGSRTPWLMYIFHRIAQSLNGEKSIIMLDEGWKLLDDPVFSVRLKDWLKTIRKQNGIIGFATQSASDALNAKIGDTIIEQSPTQIFLPNPKAGVQEYCHGFGLTPKELAVIKELNPASRCFLVKHGNDSVIARLDLSALTQFMPVLSGRTENIKFMEELMQEYGEDPALWLRRFIERTAS